MPSSPRSTRVCLTKERNATIDLIHSFIVRRKFVSSSPSSPRPGRLGPLLLLIVRVHVAVLPHTDPVPPRARLRVHQNFRGGIFSNPPLQSSQPGGDHLRVDALYRPVIGIVSGVVVAIPGVGVDAEGDAPLGLRVGIPRRIRNPVVNKTRRQYDCPYVREIEIEIEIELETHRPRRSIRASMAPTETKAPNKLFASLW